MNGASLARFIIFVLVLAAPTSRAAEIDSAAELAVGPFSRAGGSLPQGWRPLHFDGIDSLTEYDLVLQNDLWVVRARSQAAASGLIKPVQIDLREYPVLRWRWKISNVLERGGRAPKAGDDYPARVYVSFEFRIEFANIWQRSKYLLARAVFGDLPSRAITYVWASRGAIDEVFDSPYARGFVKMIALQSGAAMLDRWREEERDVYADYERAFGEAPRAVTGVAIMTDSDDTGESVTAFYGDLIFARRAP